MFGNSGVKLLMKVSRGKTWVFFFPYSDVGIMTLMEENCYAISFHLDGKGNSGNITKIYSVMRRK